MSREIPKVPMIWPFPSRNGIFVVETQVLARSLKVSCSTLAATGRPVAMIRCSSARAAHACSLLNTSKSVRPASSPAVRSGAYAASQPELTKRNRLSRSLKYTRSSAADSRLLMQVSMSSRPASPAARTCGPGPARAAASPAELVRADRSSPAKSPPRREFPVRSSLLTANTGTINSRRFRS